MKCDMGRAVLLVIVFAVLIVGTAPLARADEGCSPASLNGPYAFSAQGTLLTSILGLPAPAPWGEVARVVFDGAGSFSASATVNVGGVALNSVLVSGTYTINSNCTGSFTFSVTPQVTVTEAVIVIGDGQQFILTHTESFAVVQGRGEKLTKGGCSLASLNGPYAVSRQGTLLTSLLGLPAPAPWGEVARADFDGAGSFSGTANVNIGGVAINATFTGTYTVNSDCTGSLTVHPNVPDTITITEAFVLVDGGRLYLGTDTESFAVVQVRAERIAD